MMNNWVNFWFSIMKKLWDLAQENLVDIQGSYGILNQYLSFFLRRGTPIDVSHTLDMAL